MPPKLLKNGKTRCNKCNKYDVQLLTGHNVSIFRQICEFSICPNFGEGIDTVTIFEELNALLNMRQQNYSAQIYDTLNDEKDAYASIIRFAGFQSVADSTVLSKLLPEK